MSTKTKNETPQQQHGRKEQDTSSLECDMKQIMFTDQTGALPIRSSEENRYLMMLCKINSTKLDQWKTEHQANELNLQKKHFNVSMQQTSSPKNLDNMGSEVFLKLITTTWIMYEKVLPHIHCQIATKN